MPAVHSISTAPSAGGIVTIQGAYFGDEITETSVWLNDYASICPIVYLDNYQIMCNATHGGGKNIHVDILVGPTDHTQAVTSLLNYTGIFF